MVGRSLLIIIVLSFAAVLKAQDANTDVHLRIAQTYEQAGQFDKAEIIYRELVEIQPMNNVFFESLNKIFISKKKYNESIKLLLQKINQVPNDYNLYGLLGSTYFIMDQSEKAFESWEKGIAINPSSYIGYRVIANYAIENRAYEKAIDVLKRGKKISGDPIMFSMDLANIYAANFKFSDAAIEFCSLIEAHPEQIQSAKARISSYLNRPGAAEQTIRAVKDYSESKSQIELFDLLTFVYQSTDDYKDAFENVIEIEKKYKVNGTYVFIFAQEAYRNKQYNWASEAYNFITKNYLNSPYYQISKIGYARTLEASLDQKFFERNDSWKPFIKHEPLFTDEYKKIINAYEEFIITTPGNAVNIEALFRIAEIYRTRIFDYQKADSFYKKLSQISPNTNYGVQSLIAQGEIAIQRDGLDIAKVYFQKALSSQRIDSNDLSETNFYLARIEFWKDNFSKSIGLFREVSKNLSADFANDAIELSSIISTTKKDSLNLTLYAHADLLAIQNKHKQAAIEFKTLSDRPNLFVLNDFAKIYFAEMLLAENDLLSAIKIFEEITKDGNNSIFGEKATFLLAQCYQYGTKDLQKATQIYQKLLETFPNSLYFDRAREALNSLPTKNG
ncbi:MAG: tetratricopeptide repeat protein [Ignavibacteriales bacterium]|nr:tetratricopeptide repeat protein [Ignavibacteriales bacterium]